MAPPKLKLKQEFNFEKIITVHNYNNRIESAFKLCSVENKVELAQ